MQNEFWHNAWNSEKTGWRQRRINTRLQRYWSEMNVQAGQRVFVPLCGDSPDLLWLHQQGLEVIGAELSELAVRRFFDHNEIPCEPATVGELQLFRGTGSGEGLQIYCGDFFKLDAARLGSIAAVYDRAATVAMPEQLRGAYARQLAALLPAGARVLLISMCYDASKMQGPPFSVPDDTLKALYNGQFAVEVLGSDSGPEILGNLAERGLDTLEEIVYKLTRSAG